MVLGLVREIGEVHPADGEEDAGRRIGQGAYLAAIGTDRLAEQRGVVDGLVGWRIFSHRRRVSQRPSVIMARMRNGLVR